LPIADHRSPIRYLAAVVAGLFLATLPFWRYLPLGGVLGAHMDHEPRHGGQLGMVGDYHLEVVRRQGSVEVFVSDAERNPIVPLGGRVVFDRARATPLRWQDHRLVAPDRSTAREIEARIVLRDGTELVTSFDFADDEASGR